MNKSDKSANIIQQRFEPTSHSDIDTKTTSGRYQISRKYTLADVPEFMRFQQVNPGKDLEAIQSALMFGRAIHWLSIFEILWPRFETEDYYGIEVAYLVVNDPDNNNLPPEFFEQMARTIATFWRMQLEDLYPKGDWTVEIRDDPEITVQAEIRSRA